MAVDPVVIGFARRRVLAPARVPSATGVPRCDRTITPGFQAIARRAPLIANSLVARRPDREQRARPPWTSMNWRRSDVKKPLRPFFQARNCGSSIVVELHAAARVDGHGLVEGIS
jgi:hypothetical protein